MESRFWYIKKTWVLDHATDVKPSEFYAVAMSDIEYLVSIIENQKAHLETYQYLLNRPK